MSHVITFLPSCRMSPRCHQAFCCMSNLRNVQVALLILGLNDYELLRPTAHTAQPFGFR